MAHILNLGQRFSRAVGKAGSGTRPPGHVLVESHPATELSSGSLRGPGVTRGPPRSEDQLTSTLCFHLVAKGQHGGHRVGRAHYRHSVKCLLALAVGTDPDRRKQGLGPVFPPGLASHGRLFSSSRLPVPTARRGLSEASPSFVLSGGKERTARRERSPFPL